MQLDQALLTRVTVAHLPHPIARVSASKVAIVQHLAQRPMTSSELAKVLGLNRSAAHRHLAALVGAGLVVRIDSGRKWVYYQLSPEGEALARRLG